MKFWKRLNPDGLTYTYESYSYDATVQGAEEVTESEFRAFIDSLPKPAPAPVRDLAKEIDALSDRLAEAESRLDALQ